MAHRRTLQKSLPGMRRILSRFWPALRKHRVLIAGSLAALLAEVVLRVLEPWPLKFIFDRVLATRHSGKRSAFPALEALDPSTLLVLLASALIVLTGLRALAAYASRVGFA